VGHWVFEAVVDDGALAVAVGVGRDRGTGRGWYRAVVAGAGRRPVVVVDPDLAVGDDRSLEFRAPGLWCDHAPVGRPAGAPTTTTDTATIGAGASTVHWSVALEAFGVAVDDPFEVWGRGYGDRTPVGFDLVLDPRPWRVDGPWDVTGCEVEGELLMADERHEIHGVGVVSHDPADPPGPHPGHWRRWVVVAPGHLATSAGDHESGPPVPGNGWTGVLDGPGSRLAVGLDADPEMGDAAASGSDAGVGWTTWRPVPTGVTTVAGRVAG